MLRCKLSLKLKAETLNFKNNKYINKKPSKLRHFKRWHSKWDNFKFESWELNV